MQRKELKISPDKLNESHDNLLLGQPVRNKILNDCKNIINKFNLSPNLTIVTADGFDKASEIYINNKIKTCELVGVNANVIKLNFCNKRKNLFLRELIDIIKLLNNDKNVDGYFIQLPLPFNIKLKDFVNYIDPKKDVDGFTYSNLGKSFNNMTDLISCTPKGIIDLLKYYKINLKGSDVIIINRSHIVGIPLIPLLINEDATVTVCHSKTKDLKKKTQSADVVISAVGIPNFMDVTWFKRGATIIDVAINKDSNGLCGDVDKSTYTNKDLKITPVPKGVGVITTANVIKNTVIISLNSKKKEG